MREQPQELDRGFFFPFDYADLFRASELFVARQPLDCVPKRAGRQRSEFNRIVALEALFGPQLQTETRISAGFRNSSIKREELFGAHQNLVLVE